MVKRHLQPWVHPIAPGSCELADHFPQSSPGLADEAVHATRIVEQDGELHQGSVGPVRVDRWQAAGKQQGKDGEEGEAHRRLQEPSLSPRCTAGVTRW